MSGGALTLIECKSGKTVTPAMATPMLRLASSIRKNSLSDPRAGILHLDAFADC
jgi:hypothetical protein